jgi:hypothetical protein
MNWVSNCPHRWRRSETTFRPFVADNFVFVSGTAPVRADRNLITDKTAELLYQPDR